MIASIIDNQTIIVNDLTQFDPYAILHSGQIFRYWQTKQGWLVLSGTHWAEIIIENGQIIIKCDDSHYFYNFFDFETNYENIKSTMTISKMKKALSFGHGIRILRGDFFEIVLSFIISANNNIKRFTKTINAFCEKYGTMLACGYYSFPSLEQCINVTVNEFNQLGCGYRSQYLREAIQQLKNLDFNVLKTLSNEELYRKLLQIKGVGPKVASCIMLFSFHRLDVAPVDTWIKKAIAQLTNKEQEAILRGKYSGVAQQYIFYYLQHLQKEKL